MNFSYRKQSQFELFPGNQTAVSQQHKSRYPFSEIIISPENIIVVCIMLLMSFVVLYSLGVERGKTAKPAVVAPQKINSVQNKTSAIITPQLQQATIVGKPVAPQANKVAQAAVSSVNTVTLQATAVVNQQPKDLGSYTIQVASFKLEKSAQKEAALLKGLGYDALVAEKGTHFIVCVGRFANGDDAKKFTGRLKSKYKDSVVRRL